MHNSRLPSLTRSQPRWGDRMSATAPKTSNASRLVASGARLSEPKRYALADLLDILYEAYQDLPAEVQTAVRNAIDQLES